MINVSVIIVNYNTGALLETCIASVLKHENETVKEIIIVDNASSDNSKEIINRLEQEHIKVKGVFLDSNRGFGFANNKGVETAAGDYVLILNPDVEFVMPVLEILGQSMNSDVSAAAYTVMLYGEDGKFQNGYHQKSPSLMQYFYFYSVLSKPFYRNEKLRRKYLYEYIDEEKQIGALEVTQLPGAFMFIKKKLYEELNGFDERFFLFFEDVDFSRRIKSKGSLFLNTALKVKHLGASSMETRTNYKIYGYFILSLKKYFRIAAGKIPFLLLSFSVFANSIIKLFIEYIKKPFGVSDANVIKVHRYILKNFNS